MTAKHDVSTESDRKVSASRKNGPLRGLTIVELDSFVAGPYAGMTLAQLGADVIRIDPLGGGPDIDRWPVASSGRSLYWAGLNKGKRSICIDLRSIHGRELVREIIARASERNGAFLTNLVPGGWLSYDWLSEEVQDLIMCQVLGDNDGSAAVDYTINSALGYPMATGFSDSGPINNVLPAWDLLAGLQIALALSTSLLAKRNGDIGGHQIEVSLANVGLSVVGALGNIAEVATQGSFRKKDGNFVYGTYGNDFATKDGGRVMVVALTKKQWGALCSATGTSDVFSAIERSLGIDLLVEGVRYQNRELISAVLQPWFSARNMSEVSEALKSNGVLWGPYQNFKELVDVDPRCSLENPLFSMVDEPLIGSYLVPKSPIKVSGVNVGESYSAPLLGQHSREVVEDLLSLGEQESSRLVQEGVLWQHK